MNRQPDSWLVILHQTLDKSELHRLLETQQHRIKVSSRTIPHTCLYPQSSVAFMIVPMKKLLKTWPSNNDLVIDEELADSFVKLSNLHHKCYVLVCSAIISLEEQHVLSVIQQKYLMHSLQFLPLHSLNECVDCMSTIVKVTCQPYSTIIQERFSKAYKQLLSEENIMSILHEMNVDEKQSLLLLDGSGGLCGVAKLSVGDMSEYNVCAIKAKEIHEILHSRN